MIRHLTLDELYAGLADIHQSPTDDGVLQAIVIRPETNKRTSLKRCAVSPSLGVHGDNWAKGCWKKLADGSPHPDVQVAIMNSRTVALIAQEENRWPLAGDNLYVDMNLARENLPSGQQLAIGINGCKLANVSGRAVAQRCTKETVTFERMLDLPVGQMDVL